MNLICSSEWEMVQLVQPRRHVPGAHSSPVPALLEHSAHTLTAKVQDASGKPTGIELIVTAIPYERGPAQPAQLTFACK